MLVSKIIYMAALCRLSDKLWYLTIEFYGKWQKVAIHNETPYLISQFHNFKKKSTITITPILQI